MGLLDGARLPKFLGEWERCDLQIGPPSFFVAMTMQILVVGATERNCELVADFAAQGPGLGELQMVGIGRGLLADETGLSADEQEMRLAALAGAFLGEGESGAGSIRESLGLADLGVSVGL